MRGKQWSVDEERQLRQLVEDGRSVDEISKVMGKSVLSVKAKLFNSGLNKLRVATIVGGTVATTTATTTTPAATPLGGSGGEVAFVPVCVGGDLKLPERLPSVEEELKILAAAVEGLRQPGLSRSEQARLHYIIEGVKAYQGLFTKYVNYEGLEAEVLELRRQLASEKDT